MESLRWALPVVALFSGFLWEYVFKPYFFRLSCYRKWWASKTEEFQSPRTSFLKERFRPTWKLSTSTKRNSNPSAGSCPMKTKWEGSYFDSWLTSPKIFEKTSHLLAALTKQKSIFHRLSLITASSIILFLLPLFVIFLWKKYSYSNSKDLLLYLNIEFSDSQKNYSSVTFILNFKIRKSVGEFLRIVKSRGIPLS